MKIRHILLNISDFQKKVTLILFPTLESIDISLIYQDISKILTALLIVNRLYSQIFLATYAVFIITGRKYVEISKRWKKRYHGLNDVSIVKNFQSDHSVQSLLLKVHSSAIFHIKINASRMMGRSSPTISWWTGRSKGRISQRKWVCFNKFRIHD